jgi:hypothetical protein
MLTAEEKNAGWRLLFDGRPTAGWRGYNQDGARKLAGRKRIAARPPRKGKSAGDIITVDQFDNFELALQWKMIKGNNSGVFYRAT